MLLIPKGIFNFLSLEDNEILKILLGPFDVGCPKSSSLISLLYFFKVIRSFTKEAQFCPRAGTSFEKTIFLVYNLKKKIIGLIDK